MNVIRLQDDGGLVHMAIRSSWCIRWDYVNIDSNAFYHIYNFLHRDGDAILDYKIDKPKRHISSMRDELTFPSNFAARWQIERTYYNRASYMASNNSL